MDTDKNCKAACEQLMLRLFTEGCENVDELARDLKRMLYKFSPSFSVEIHKAKLRFHLMNSLPENDAF